MSSLENWSLDKWLKNLSLRKYKQTFSDNGYDTAELCASLNKEDLDAIGITNKHHRSTLFTQSRKLLDRLNKEGLTVSVEAVDSAGQGQAMKGTGFVPPPPSSAPPASHQVEAQHLPDYSEPWNSNSATNQTTSKNGLQGLKPTNGSPSEVSRESRSPLHRKGSGGPVGPSSGGRRMPPVSPTKELPAFKMDGLTGLTRLQLKLKIREELFSRGVVLTEPPYCKDDGSPDEGLVMDLAAGLADKFSVESLEMYDALKEVWSNANKSDFAAKRTAKESATPVPKDNYNEPFDTVSSNTSPLRTSPVTKVFASPAPKDNYDEPFDTVSSIPSPLRTSPVTKKNATIPQASTLASTNGCYDEPFDSVSNGPSTPDIKPAPEIKPIMQETSQTLPSPRLRKSYDASTDGRSSKTSPKLSPFHPSSSKPSKLSSLFKRKEKARSQSVRESDLSFLDDPEKLRKKHGLLSFPSKTSPLAAKHVSAENISDMGAAPTVDQLEYLKSGIPPPLPTPRTSRQATESSEDSDDTHPPQHGRTKVHSLAQRFEGDKIIRIRSGVH